VLGLVIVVPRLGFRPWPLPGDDRVDAGLGDLADTSRPEATEALEEEAEDGTSVGPVIGVAVPDPEGEVSSSIEASISSGGNLSFSISLLRASSKLVIASLIPSAPLASAPNGNLADPDMLLSSETASASSLHG